MHLNIMIAAQQCSFKYFLRISHLATFLLSCMMLQKGGHVTNSKDLPKVHCYAAIIKLSLSTLVLNSRD